MSKGNIKVKQTLTKTDCLMCKPEDIQNHVLRVIDIAVDNSGYLCIIPSGNGLVDVHIDDTEWFKPKTINDFFINAGNIN